MTATAQRSGQLQVVETAECLALLRQRTVGRIAVNRRGHGPLVVPVVYAVGDDGTIVFRTGSGTKLARIGLGAVAFEVDDFDERDRSGWSVLVDGLAHRVEPDVGAAAAVRPWIGEALDHGVRLVPTRITGRRVVP